jgi:hypothetical protein
MIVSINTAESWKKYVTFAQNVLKKGAVCSSTTLIPAHQIARRHEPQEYDMSAAAQINPNKETPNNVGCMDGRRPQAKY